ncbi:pyridoxamine 5'-phosphate oxidase [Sinobacterium caligoides]|uniref:Pyridoxamine 5'-phosphate oxidase n=1 Tax=Sinobacterium caligoides TaxID=933926 RepID=A0A3N2DZ27_9GAMM|nr:pyridoxamine 5'-phosphate oxidase family protein [Sinobacterium caligoides]ROS05121.1 pyridoxamine 5'-phosphate oxidase [Sinobacterium caligoides]
MPSTTKINSVWSEIERQIFSTVGFVTPDQHARTSGVVHTLDDNKVYFSVENQSWKARHIAKNPYVSLTVIAPRRIPLLPWVKLPPATISFSGKAVITNFSERSPAIKQALFRGTANKKAVAKALLVEVVPQGYFLTYGIGMPFWKMVNPSKAQQRVKIAPRTTC